MAVASPATVSRCGMVYIDPDELKWMPYVQTWISGLGDKVVHTVFLVFLDLLEHFFSDFFELLQKKFESRKRREKGLVLKVSHKLLVKQSKLWALFKHQIHLYSYL